MTKKKIILIGGGGHCKSCIDIIEQLDTYEIFGILDVSEKLGQQISGYKVIGNDDAINTYSQQGFCFLITLGQIKSALRRKKLFDYLTEIEATIETIISPLAYVAKSAQIGTGSIIMHNATIIASSKIGSNCIINTGSTIEHDAVVGNHCHISTHVIINGECQIGNEVFVGSNSTISSQISISDKIVIGAGTVVISALSNQGVYVGNPSKLIK